MSLGKISAAMMDVAHIAMSVNVPVTMSATVNVFNNVAIKVYVCAVVVLSLMEGGGVKSALFSIRESIKSGIANPLQRIE